MSLAPSQIADFVLLTHNKLVARNAFEDLQTDLQNYAGVDWLWKKKKTPFEGGHQWEFDCQMDHNHTAKATGLFEKDSSNIRDTMAKGVAPVRFMNAHYMIERREPIMQRGEVQRVNYVKTKIEAMYSSFYEKLESFIWGKPTTSSDVKTPWGIPYWVVKNASEGFHGGNPSGFSGGAGGLAVADYPRWSNYTGTYAATTAKDLIRTMRKAKLLTKFKSPLNHKTPMLSTGNGIFVNAETFLEMEELFDTRNMNLGAELDGTKVTFNSNQIIHCAKLDDDTQNPVYMLDFKKLSLGCLAGWEKEITVTEGAGDCHTAIRTDLDASLNVVCTNRRNQTVLYKV